MGFRARCFLGPASKNVACAIRSAKSSGIRYLFIDIISIDQTLTADLLIAEVVRFGAFYASVPAMAEYDDHRLNVRCIPIRLWITSEIKLMLGNPYKIVYVGRLQQGAYIHIILLQYLWGYIPRSQMSSTSFGKQL